MDKKLAAVPLLVAILACSLGKAVEPNPPPTEAQYAPTSTEAEVPAIPPTPAYIPPECAGSELATVEPEVLLHPTAAPAPNVPISTDLQLEVLSGLENAVLDVYLYRDFGGIDWPAAVAEVRSQAQAGMETE
ncbi:MAG: hypothetical protein ACRDHG_12750, partial [Anaerolineales bacterium]